MSLHLLIKFFRTIILTAIFPYFISVLNKENKWTHFISMNIQLFVPQSLQAERKSPISFISAFSFDLPVCVGVEMASGKNKIRNKYMYPCFLDDF